MAKKISIKGEIIRSDNKWIYDWFGIEATCPNDVSKILNESSGDDIEVEINSGGGDIFAGSEIYTALRSYKGNVFIKIVGLAASAASVISQAGKSEISPTALFMIHNVSSRASGDHNAMEHSASVLRTADQSIANAYKEKTGLTDKELLDLMDKETWLSAEQAVKYKFVDGIMFQNSQVALYNSTSGITQNTINKMKNLIGSPNSAEADSDFLMQQMQARINIQRLKGEKRHV